MASSSQALALNVEKLTGSNYRSWKFNMKMLLIERGLWECVINEETIDADEDQRKYEKTKIKQEKALATISLSISTEQQIHVIDCKTASEAWTTLEQIFEPKSRARILQLKKQFVNIKFIEEENIINYLSRLKTCSDHLRKAGCEVKDEDLAYSMLAGLPDSYDGIIMHFGNMTDDEFTSSKVRQVLLTEHERRKTRKEDSSKEVLQVNKHQNNSSTDSRRKCYRCGKIGHIATNCRGMKQTTTWNRDNQHYQRKVNKSDNFLAALNLTSDEDSWLLDSGATNHVCRNKDWFVDLREVSSDPIMTASGTTEAKGYGHIFLQTSIHNECIEIKLNNVLYVPNVRRNLLSVSKIEENGNRVTFRNMVARVFNAENRIIAEATNVNGLYIVKGKTLNSSKTAFNSERDHFQNNSLRTWHQRLCHIDSNAIEKMAREELVIGLEISSRDKGLCDDCCIAKSTKASHKNLGNIRSKQTLELIHTDICCPMPVKSTGGNRYLLSFVDDFSRRITVYLLKNKDEVLKHFDIYRATVERQTGNKIKVLRSDNGLEFCNRDFQDKLQKLGIKHERTNVYSPQMNGVAERVNRTLLDMARACLHSANLPQRFWAEAVNTAAYIKNKCYNTALKDKVPDGLWLERNPSVRHLKAFGCLAYSHIPRERRRKLDHRACRCILVGYSTQTRGYRLWCPELQKVIETKHVRFDESKIGLEWTKIVEETEPERYNHVWLEPETNHDNDLENELPSNLDSVGVEDTLPQPSTSKNIVRNPYGRKGKPRVELNFLDVTEPQSFEEAVQSPEAMYWRKAMEDELRVLQERGTWELSTLPPGKKPISSRWVYKVKTNESGNVERFKARLVARGFSQKQGIDFQETYAPVINLAVIRVLITLSLNMKWYNRHLDVDNAYLYGDLEEEIYMLLPEGVERKDNEVYKLLRPIYGLRQSGRNWNLTLDHALQEMGFTRLESCNCIYTYLDKAIIAVYVDDLALFGESEEILRNIEQKINERFRVKNLGAIRNFLGVQIGYPDEETVVLSQSTYVKSILQKFNMIECRPVSTPLDISFPISKGDCPTDEEEKERMKAIPYRELIGSLLYLANCTRPDLMFSVTRLAQFASNPGRRHWQAAKHVLRYLHGSINLSLVYRRTDSNDVCAYSDADWASDIDDRRSNSGTAIVRTHGILKARFLDTEKYRAKYNRICALSKEISEIDSRYHGLLLEDETITEVKIEEEFEGCENYVQGMFDIENKYLSRCETARDRVDGSLVESAANSVVNTESKRTIRLPKVELPKFKGNLEDWLSWWGQFNKFHYLLQAVVEGSRAHRLVCSYPITEDNYPKVVQALKDRFGDKNLLIEHYIRRLLKLVVSNARKENLPLDEIYDDLTAHLKNLESLGVNTEMAGVFLYPLVESSLPLDIIQVWQRNPAVGYGIKEEGAENGDKSDASGRLQALMDFLRDEVKGAERMAFAKENFEGNSSMRATGSQLKTPRKTPLTVSNLFGSAFKTKCIFCQRDNHLSSRCFVASRLTPSERDQRIKEAKVCFKCLKGNHLKRECRADIKCRNCGKDHLDIFCNKIALKQGGNNSFKGETSKVVNEGNATCTGVNMSARTCANDILLMTSVAKLKGAKETKEVKVLFDTGSHYSYIKRSIVEKLGLNKIGEISLEKSLFGGGNLKEALHGKYVLKLGSLTNKIDVDIVALDQPEICARIPPIPRGCLLYKLKRKKIYIHPSNFRNEEIDILIGSDYFGQLLTGKVVHLGEDLTAVETKLGWTLMGQSPVVGKEDKVQIALNMLVARNNLKDLWELDILGIQDPIEVVSKKKRETELKEHFIKNIKRDEDQRYSVALPWKCERNNIPSNLEIAQRRLEACTSKLRKEKMGLIERIEENRPQKKGHYLPHRPVFKAESRTTPLHPVFDASCRSYNGLSLNDYLEKGPNLLEKIPEILIRFREKGIGVLADIRKAFQMITVQLQDQDFLRFLWWDQTDPMKLTVFRHKRVVFGLNCSPFILGAVIDHHLNSVQGPAAEIAKTMARSFYMDNLVTSLSSQEEVQQFQNTAVNIMEMAKMDLREWEFNLPVSNSKEEKGTTTKVLGLVWDKVEDVLNCDVSIEKDLPRRLTKRIILSKIQQVFDPLGVYSPIFLPPKLLLQSQIKIPRHIWFDQTNKNEIHVFCDASKSAYAAVAYMRSEVQGGVHLSLLWSKSRLAPTKRVTIPRLELLACVLGARLVKSISTALTNSCPVTLWTDSSTVMAWLKRKNEWNVFVRNRVQEIRDTVNNENWKFVYGKFNPADLPSRGCSIVQFVSTNWWEGPEWLKGEKESWPSFEPTIDEEEIIKEKRKTLQAHTTLIVEANRWFLDRRSKYSLNIRIMAWVLRFLDNARRIPTERGNLKVIELERAERKLLKLVQQETFPGKQAPKNGLKTIKSIEGLWCVETKLLHGQDSEVFKRPILLPRNHPLVEQMVREIHQQNGHGGAQFILSQLREKFWIIGGRRLIKQIIGKCVICRRHNQKPIQTPGAALPTNRIGLGKPFEVTGVDLLGPLHLKGGSKVWVALFTCAVYRAVHLEIVRTLEANTFLLALKRFICRRGRPGKIYSDNGTNFSKTNELLKRLDWGEIERESSVKRIQWIFIPPSAPWWGGFWERLVRVVKSLLVRMLGFSKLNYVQLETALCEVESIINNRALSYISEDDQDLIPLTPQMFLQTNANNEFPELEKIRVNSFTRKYKILSKLNEELKQRFRKEYLGVLIQRAENKRELCIKEGDLVLIGQDNTKRILWPVGKIIKLYLGKDGVNRVARVKTSTGEWLRPVQRLSP
ncbi:hypothetical protein LAZ67_X001289 [Cordylochernes scorpioides]|uniref:Retrovirus-related Pol polyprotein from transposon TNT 1-94 n=1 Tax=Cordylochernes scorpioides TaxID=51811 RepID=A0ABY6LTE9_9ARAC|nr:hypothetical protein LAZ67_X001289 [Cordylochernes scorpioides]